MPSCYLYADPKGLIVVFSRVFVYQIHALLCGFARLRKYLTTGAESAPVASRASKEKEKRKSPISDYCSVPSFSLEFKVCDLLTESHDKRVLFNHRILIGRAEEKAKNDNGMLCYHLKKVIFLMILRSMV